MKGLRPINLIISAFGPYAEEEVITFSEMQENNIFLITGPTGAGKTTIFDAISYALFGVASGSSRDYDGLRSDFAATNCLTFVEFEFKLRNQLYKIRREPPQLRKKVRGEGFVLKNTEVQLICQDGSIYTKVTEVDEKIKSILGINKNQFKQIVMLPQGEFRELLEAESKEREEIFRKIFDTFVFERIQKELDEQYRELDKKAQMIRAQRETHIQHIDTSEAEYLQQQCNTKSKSLNHEEVIIKTKETVEEDKKKNRSLLEELAEKRKKQEGLKQECIVGQEINKKLIEKKQLQKQVAKVLEKEEELKEKRKQYKQGKKALIVVSTEEALIEKQKDLKNKKNQFEFNKQQLEKSEKQLKEARIKLQKEEENEEIRKKLQYEITILESQQKKVKDYEEKKSTIEMLKNTLLEKEQSRGKIKKQLKDYQADMVSMNEKWLQIQEKIIERESLKNLVEKNEEMLQEWREFCKQIHHYIQQKKKHNRLQEEYSQFEKKYLELKEKYEGLEDLYQKGQAGILAIHLKQGKRCPVCGATHHPHPAQLMEGVPSEAVLKSKKEQYEMINKEKEHKLKILYDLNGTFNQIFQRIQEQKSAIEKVLQETVPGEDASRWYTFISKKGMEKSKAVEKDKKLLKTMEEEIQKNKGLQQKIQEIKEKIEEREVSLEKLDEEAKEFFAKVKSQEEMIGSLENELPQYIRSLERLKQEIQNKQKFQENLEKIYQEAKNEVEQGNIRKITLETELAGMKSNIEEDQKNVDGKERELNTKVLEAGFSNRAEYQKSKLTQKELNILEEAIQQFDQNKKLLEDRLEHKERETEGLEPTLIEDLKTEIQAIEGEIQKLEEEERRVYARIKNNQRVVTEIEKINQDLMQVEEELTGIGEISKVANGDNEERITFERYVLAAYFEEIIEAANIRFYKMTGGRFVLQRKEEKLKGRKQGGLELEVFDQYTGKARHVKTLSGGESFKASLALALGLADVVQSYAGGISLDTMFIDEGFGTLDPESLEHAIQCLIDLQKGGRLVGIISHVPELKERINVCLEITPAKEGSHAKFVI